MLKIIRRDIKIGTVCLNGQPLEFKKRDGKFVAEADVIGEFRLDIKKQPELLFEKWFLRALLFWIIGIAGLFTPSYDKKGAVLNYSLYGDAADGGSLEIQVLSPKTRISFKRAVNVKCDYVNIYSEENIAYVSDKTAVKRKKIYTAFSWIARILIIAVIAVVIIMTL